MKKHVKGLLAAILCICMVLSLASCGKSGNGKSDGGGSGSGGAGGSSMPEITIRDGVVKAQQITFDDEEFNTEGLQILALEDESFYGFNYSYADDGSTGYQLVSFKTDGTGLKAVDFKAGGEDSEISAAAYRGGSYYLAVASYTNSPALDYMLEHEDNEEDIATTGEAAKPDEDAAVDEEDMDAMIPEGLSEDASSSYQIWCVSDDGTVKWKQDINATSDYYYVDSMVVSDEGLFLVSSEGVSLYSTEDGTFKEDICALSPDELTGVLYALKDGTVLMMEDSGSSSKILTYDKGQKKFVESVALPTALLGSSVFGGTKYGIYLAGDDGIYGVNPGSSQLTPVVNYVNSDLDVQGVMKVIEAEDGRLAIQAYGSEFSLDTYILEPVAPEDVKEKKEITLGGYYIGYEVRSEVINFNKENDQYRITLLDYSQYDLDSDDFDNSTGMTRMNTDIVSGNVPDIVLLSEYMPVNSYISKGLFTDLTQLYDSDPDIDRSDFMENVVDAFRTDGKIYVAVPGFTVTGVAGKKKYIGDGKDLTIAKAKEVASSLGLQDKDIFGLTDRDTVFSSAIEFSGDRFINREEHTCDFNNAEFQELLEFVKNLPEQISEEQYNDYYTQYLGDKAILGLQYISTVYDYYYMTRQLYGDLDVTVTGFPSGDNKGAAVSASMQLGISSKASDQDGCWQFVRRFLLPEYQNKMEGSLPISRAAIKAQGQAIIDDLKEQQKEYEDYMNELNSSMSIGSPAAEPVDEAPAEAKDDEDAAQEDPDEDLEESEDLTGKPIPEEDFNGTHEEYEAYVKEFEKDMASADATTEEVIIPGDEILADEENAAAYGLSALPEFGEDDLKALEKILDGLSFSVNAETDVLNIISEEAAAFFAGQKSAAEVSDIIQSRVQVYLKENA